MHLRRSVGLVALAAMSSSLLALAAPSASAASPALVISQAYGGGGNAGAPLTNDYVELFNRSAAPVTTGGLSIQYASATGTGAFAPLGLPDRTVPAGGYLLIQLAGGSAGAALPAADATGSQNASGTAGKLALVTGTTSLGCNGGSAPCTPEQAARIVDLVGYGSANFFEGAAAAPTLSNSTAAFRLGGGCTDTDQNGADFTAAAPAPRSSATTPAPCTGGGGGDPEPPVEPEVPATVTPISAIQGSGAVSPLLGQEVLIEGVVVGDFQDRGQFGGFYVQGLSPDGDPLTSEGIRVFTFATPVAVGDRVRVVGTVSEFASGGLSAGSETQLSPVRSVQVLGTAAVPAATPVTLPFALANGGVDGQERYEGMLATLTNSDLVATDLFTLGRFGEVSLTTGEVLYIPTTAEQAAANDVDRITLDDGLSGQNLAALPYTIGGDRSTLPRAGDRVVGAVTGVLTFSFGEWRIVPAVGTTIDFARSEPRPVAPDEVGGDVQVGSFNVLNYFVDFGGANRGADNAAELERQQDKLVAAITGLDADVVGLIEIANDDGDALDTLVAALNAAQTDPADHYTAVDAPVLNAPTSLGGTYGTDAIRQAIIYRAAVVTAAGPAPSDPALLNPADPLFPEQPVFDRPPAVQSFVPVGGKREFTVVVNHFKSKGSTNAQCGTPDPFGGNCDDLRERQSAALLDLVESLGVRDVALLGDFNSYEQEQPIEVLEAAGWVSVVADQPRADRTSYSFDGEFGSLDYIFLSPSLARAQTGADIWQINSAEAVALDYNSFNQQALYAPGPYASSDHDPVLVGLDLVPGPVVGPVRPGRPAELGRPTDPGRPDGAGRPAQPGPPPFAGTPARR